MKLEDWKLADGPRPTVRRTARLRRVHVPSCALLGAGFGLALALVVLPLHFLSPESPLLSSPGAPSGASDVPEPHSVGLRYVAWIVGLEVLVGALIGTLASVGFNLFAPLVGGLAFELELEREGAGDHALEPYEEQPVFEGR